MPCGPESRVKWAVRKRRIDLTSKITGKVVTSRVICDDDTTFAVSVLYGSPEQYSSCLVLPRVHVYLSSHPADTSKERSACRIGRSLNPPPPAPSPVVLDTGRVSYELLRSLGQGHHGELLLTRQRYTDGVGGLALLKRLNRVVRQEDYQRLVEEARLGGQLRHPNILSVQMLAGGAAEPVLVLEYVEGQTLGEVMRLAARTGVGLSEAFALYVTAEIADGLHYAHTLLDEKGRHLGIVHRDVTPQGILVGRHGEVKLMDFGGAWSRLEGRISTEGDSDLGNLSYSSPERAGMEKLDGRSDLFSLGLVLLELLTGHHLLEATARYEAELLHRQLRPREEAARVAGLEEMSTASTAELMKRVRDLRLQKVEEGLEGLDGPLRAILLKALAPHKDDRYATGEALAQALREQLWRSGQRYGRAQMVAEVAALGEVDLEEGVEEDASAASRKGRGGAKARRGPPPASPETWTRTRGRVRPPPSSLPVTRESVRWLAVTSASSARCCRTPRGATSSPNVPPRPRCPCSGSSPGAASRRGRAMTWRSPGRSARRWAWRWW